jgi:hypothetical protein
VNRSLTRYLRPAPRVELRGIVLTVVWTAKGGSGATVVAGAIAGFSAEHHTTLAVDMAGDLPGALGLDRCDAIGVSNWLSSVTTAPADGLRRLEHDVSGQLSLLSYGTAVVSSEAPWTLLAACFRADERHVVVDAGLATQPGAAVLASHADASVLVIRPCYLALRRATQLPTHPSAIVLIDEPGRSLRDGDVADALGAPVVARLCVDAAVARTVDAGLFASHRPRSLRPLQTLVPR